MLVSRCPRIRFGLPLILIFVLRNISTYGRVRSTSFESVVGVICQLPSMVSFSRDAGSLDCLIPPSRRLGIHFGFLLSLILPPKYLYSTAGSSFTDSFPLSICGCSVYVVWVRVCRRAHFRYFIGFVALVSRCFERRKVARSTPLARASSLQVQVLILVVYTQIIASVLTLSHLFLF